MNGDYMLTVSKDNTRLEYTKVVKAKIEIKNFVASLKEKGFTNKELMILQDCFDSELQTKTFW